MGQVNGTSEWDKGMGQGLEIRAWWEKGVWTISALGKCTGNGLKQLWIFKCVYFKGICCPPPHGPCSFPLFKHSWLIMEIEVIVLFTHAV